MYRYLKFGQSIAGLAFLCLAAACSGKGGNGNFPDNFDKIGDAGRVAYVMEQTSPDSVARFICDAALGKVEGVKIDSIQIATLYAYEHYKDNDLASFSNTLDSYSAALPLKEKMKLYVLLGEVDAQQLGYQLGLEYVNNIRSKKMTADEVSAELKEFKKACGADHDTYRRFVKGFKVVLEKEHGGARGVDNDIYNRFINLSEE